MYNMYNVAYFSKKWLNEELLEPVIIVVAIHISKIYETLG